MKITKVIKASTSTKPSKRVQDWIQNQESVQADSALGEDEGFFTRDDEIEFVELPLEDMIRKEDRWGFKPEDVINLRAYIDDNNLLEVDCDIDGCEFTISTQIDMRKIRRPKDLKKYALDLFWKFDEEYSKCIDDVEACDSVQAAEMLSGDREFHARPLKELKKGAWFTLKPIGEPKESQVWVKGDYDKIDKEFSCYSLDDINRERFFKGSKLVYDDNNFEI